MPSFAIYRDRITITRPTAVLLSDDAAATMSLATQPSKAAFLQVRVSGGTSDTGTIQIDGVDEDGGALSQTLTFTGTREYAQTTEAYASVDTNGITTTGLADEVTVPTVEMRAVGADGSPQDEQTSTVVTSYPAHIDHRRANWPRAKEGTQETESLWIGIPYTSTWAPKAGDVITDQYGKVYELKGRPRWKGQTGDHHWECPARRRE